MNHDTETFAFSGTIHARTAKAILIEWMPDQQDWFPLSQVLEIHGDPHAEIVVSAWIAKKKGLI